MDRDDTEAQLRETARSRGLRLERGEAKGGYLGYRLLDAAGVAVEGGPPWDFGSSLENIAEYLGVPPEQ